MSTGRLSSTQRALAILDCFTTDAPTLTLSQIARRLRQPVSSTHRQLQELTHWGALERDASGRYAIGLHLWEVGSLAPRSKSLREVSLPFLEDLYEATHQNVQVAVLDGDEVVYVERLFSHAATRIIADPGTRLPLHPTGVGRVLLAHSGTERINEVLRGPLQPYTEYTVVDPHQLRRELAAILRTGYAITDRQFELVSTSVAAPIRGPDQSVIAALSIIVPSRDGTAHGFVPAVVTAARRISRALGAQLKHPVAPARR
ncbi:IclR family transcriptional regulator [Streptomyces sp. NPDC052042]|uniref:IclR family transcriptional regulator n=1 Tax=Streptomyces sp. NPDC052042 TaxID=3365683 RepID=UPI0037D6710D